MKKTIALLLALVLLFALCGCSKKAPAATKEPAAPAQEPAVAAEPVPAAKSDAAPATEPAPAAEPAPAPAAEAAPAPPANFSPDFTFSITGRDGVDYDESVFAEHPITIINAWNSWVEPSIAEMATLAKLWDNYRDRGLMVFGLYGMSSTNEEIKNVLAKTGASYPLIGYAPALIEYQSGSFPNTFLVDREGHVLTHAPDPDVLADLEYNFGRETADFLAARIYVEPMSYEEWEAIILPYLN